MFEVGWVEDLVVGAGLRGLDGGAGSVKRKLWCDDSGHPQRPSEGSKRYPYCRFFPRFPATPSRLLTKARIRIGAATDPTLMSWTWRERTNVDAPVRTAPCE